MVILLTGKANTSKSGRMNQCAYETGKYSENR